MAIPLPNLSHQKLLRFARSAEACPDAIEWIRANKLDAKTAWEQAHGFNWDWYLFTLDALADPENPYHRPEFVQILEDYDRWFWKAYNRINKVYDCVAQDLLRRNGIIAGKYRPYTLVELHRIEDVLRDFRIKHADRVASIQKRYARRIKRSFYFVEES